MALVSEKKRCERSACSIVEEVRGIDDTIPTLEMIFKMGEDMDGVRP
jgi:hypothetical protein